MVCSVSAIKTAGVAAQYLSQTDNYYSEHGHAPTAWQGKGAAALGLAGAVTTAQAENLMRGRLPDGQQVGGDDHRPGWDATFSAPKSVSVAALVHGDSRLIEAHDAAVRDALAWLEREVAATRIREDSEIRTEATGNLVIASYRHDLNRNGEAQLHTHNVLMNMTKSLDNQWRSLESKPLYRLQAEAGAVHRASLARRCERLGYDIEKTTEGKHPSFELAKVTAGERDLFSSRSRQIEAELAKMGLTRETATPEQKQVAALATRTAKQVGDDRAQVAAGWRETARAAGFEVGGRPEAREIDGAEYERRADNALAHAVAHLGERETRFTTRQITAEARKYGMGGVDDHDITGAIARAADAGGLVPAATRQYDAIIGQKEVGEGYTTPAAQAIERDMLAAARAGGAGSVSAITTPEGAVAAIERQEVATGYPFNAAQRRAALAILAGDQRITLIQGFAGTAKTTSVLAATAEEFRRQGHEIVALAPTHSAAGTLASAIGGEGQTVAKFLGSREQPACSAGRIYIVDEASMLSARDMARLLEKTGDGRLVLVGDVKQLGSVEAGAAFRQLQNDSGLKTEVLDEIVRQKNDELRAAVYDALRGDAAGALSKVEVRELDTRVARVAAIADDYTSAAPADREKTLVIAPGKDDRREINEAVRQRLVASGELGQSIEIDVLEKRDMTAAEASQAINYAVGDLVEAGRDYKSLGLQKGEAVRVVAVDVNRNRITIEAGGKSVEIDPSRYAKLSVHETRKLPVAVGDHLVMRANSETLKNGAALRVAKIDERHVHAVDEAGKTHKISRAEPQKLDHGYAQTAHAAQGRTCQTVLVHAESSRVNLQNQQNMYVALSRATTTARVYTDNRERLAEQVGRESGQKETALSDSESDKAFPNRNPKGVSESESEKPAASTSTRETQMQQAIRGREKARSNPNRSESKSDKAFPNRNPKGVSESEKRRDRDATLAEAALATRGAMPSAKQAGKDIEAGRADWTRDSAGEMYLQYKNGNTYSPALHGRVRETDLRQLATLGLTTKKAVLVDKHLIDFRVMGKRISAIKTGEKVLISREGAVGKWAGQQKDLMRERHQEEGRGGPLRQANDAAKSAVLTKAEGWRAATLQEAVRARLGAASATRAAQAEARTRLEGKVAAGGGRAGQENVRDGGILGRGAGDAPQAAKPTTDIER